MRVRLNLATRPLESHRRFLLGAGFSALVAAVVFVALGWHVYTVREAAAEDRARKEKISREYARYQEECNDLKRFFEQKDIKGLNERAAFINGIIAVRSFNWTRMFMDLEHILPGGARIISIEPKQVSGQVELNLTFGAADDEVKLRFLRALETSKQFSDVQIHSDAKVVPGAGASSDARVVHLSTFYSGA
jgi:Tfp pilus assembly protein PilN